ncbi:MAG: restriction endonuclease subunit S [Bacteroidales bacterium]|nr:restriction endonuclease subunit S [Bacteroidales bacterium]
MQIHNYKYFFLTHFENIHFWDVNKYAQHTWDSIYDKVELLNCINEENKKHKLYKYPKEEFGILGINNKDGIFDAYLQKGKEINQAYKYMEDGWLAYNPYRVNIGSIGIKRKEQRYQYISPAYVVFSCKENLLSDYIYLTFKTNVFNQYINKNTTGSVRQILSFDTLKSLQIPLPALSDQQRLVNKYNTAIRQTEKQEQQANKMEEDIENYLCEALGIEKQKEEKWEMGKLYFVEFSAIVQWRVEKSLMLKQKNILNSSKYNNVALIDYADINPSTNIRYIKDNESISFVPMGCVSDIYGEIISMREGEKSNSKGYTRFQDNDLIWAKITPCMQNGKSAVARNLKNGFGYGSTEFHVLRVKNKNLSIDFLHLLLRTNKIRKDAVRYFTGSTGQQRVPKSYLESLSIPLPPLTIQNKIIIHIKSLQEHIKTLRHQAEKNRKKAIENFEKEIFK